ncbi:FKBP-type peptidyl-prolyl cis-trans isomerase [Polyangium sp. 15x6]|uniref:FKBP-type peptidyl-prolyl cis-trans isomerase n=1 Tax=Polyangium sp. 15x6 TaxID=3042687 RepID=UPI00249A6119|nr:FKBP-type peptidyl-prolyl cis-trans isomerase [Polyangium sp. 15x6]MDI3283042.1 FKBP-type peptidyl-prolyl cis-trans isomerase [Polyangium sp. 15x6]
MMAIRRLGSLAVVALGVVTAACENKVPEPSAEPRAAAPREPEKPEPADLIKEDITVGTGPEAREGDKVKVHYTGRLLKTNFMFDSSVGKEPFEFELGKGEVIKGWDQGVAGMKVGGKRKLTIPSKLGYGDDGSPPKIPGKATLVFDVELLEVVSPSRGPADGKDTKAKDAPKKDAPKK